MSASLFDGDIGLGVVIVIGVVVIVAMTILGRLIRRDPDVRRTRFGWFVERDRYDVDEPFEPPPHAVLPSTAGRKIEVDDETKSWPTVELPPSEGGKQ